LYDQYFYFSKKNEILSFIFIISIDFFMIFFYVEDFFHDDRRSTSPLMR